MKKLITITITVIAFIISLFTITGCSDHGEINNKSALGMVVGAHKYSPVFSVSQDLQEKISYVTANYGEISITVCQGSPKTVAKYNIEPIEEDVGSDKLEQISKANTEAIITEISNLKAETKEVDTLASITKEANILQSVGDDIQSKSLVIFDTGLSTTGYIDFTLTNLLNSEPEYIVKKLEEHYVLPDLRNIDVVWYGLGQTRGEQTFDEENRYKLKEIWTAVLNSCNAKSLKFNDDELSSETYSNVPDVSIVDMVSYKIEAQSTDNSIPVIAIDEDTIEFKADSAEIKNKTEASNIIASLAEILSKDNAPIYYVIGSTATLGEANSAIKLSEERALTIVNALSEKGISTERLIPVGIGFTSCCLRVDDTDDSGGDLLEEQAKKNRTVFIVSERSSTYLRLKSEGII